MSYQRVLLLIAVGVTFAATAKLPSYFSKCKKSDANIGECIVKSANTAMSQFTKGDDSHHIQSLNPLKVDALYTDIDGGLYINLTDLTITGIEETMVKEAKIDFDKKKFEFVLKLPYLNVQSQYSVNGKILILPITGTGPLNVTYVEPTLQYSFEYDLKERGKNEYMEPKNTVLTYESMRTYFQLDNLFNGDKRLGEEMTKFLNENWKEVDGEIGLKLGEALGEIISAILKNFFAKVPFSDFFED